ncbi:MAG: hypothetical protein AMJ45_03955 [Syntrophobacter sp. DG_60]|nr:MAG: hypothetical protein AMJ45_03955 [Syntrophobacter sp. DG_60]
MKIITRNEAIEIRPGWFRWKIYLEGEASELDKIEYVEYILHPTFPNPIVKVANRESNFSLEAEGWGEFMVKLNLFMKDGSVKHKEHWLQLFKREMLH